MSNTNRVIGTKVPTQYTREATPGFRLDSGPYIGEVKDNVDEYRHGRISVYIPEFGGDPDNPDFWKIVNYASPFFGEVNPRTGDEKTGMDSKYGHTLQSYGMWFTPPDIGVQVLVTFVAGNQNRGYWFACIPRALAHQMVPAVASSPNYLETNDIAGAAKADSPVLPVTEPVLDNLGINAFNKPAPVHQPQAEILLNQGLATDLYRGAVTSSSQRESPSKVFGFSTPGRPDPDPALEADGATPVSKEELLKKINTALEEKDATFANKIHIPKKRKGGHSFIMDDGDVTGDSQLVRLRSAAGHQILMNDSLGIIYIINSMGTAWIEMTPDGSINTYSGGSINVRTTGTLNFHADENIKFHAGANIVMKANSSVFINADSNTLVKSKGTTIIDGNKTSVVSDSDTNVYGSKLKLTADDKVTMTGGFVSISSGGGGKPAEAPDLPTQQFASTTKSNGVWRGDNDNISESIVDVLPSHEPWTRPSYQVDKTAVLLSVKAADDSNISPNTGINLGSALGTLTPITGITAAATGLPLNVAGIANVLGADKLVTASEVQEWGKNVPLDKIGNLSDVQKQSLYAQIGKLESGLRYSVTGGINNTGGAIGAYLGAYQLGTQDLTRIGYLNSTIANNLPTAVNNDSAWNVATTGVGSATAFLNNAVTQQSAFNELMKQKYTDLVQSSTIQFSDKPDIVAAKLLVSKLSGDDAATKYFKNGQESFDANGTSCSQYTHAARHAINVANNLALKIQSTIKG